MKAVRLVTNPGHARFSAALSRRRYVRIGTDARGRWRGEYRWQVGDRAWVHLDAALLWTQVEVELVAVLVGSSRYGAVVRGFDGVAVTLGGLRLGDKLQVRAEHFFALWRAAETREAGRRGQPMRGEGVVRGPTPGSG